MKFMTYEGNVICHLIDEKNLSCLNDVMKTASKEKKKSRVQIRGVEASETVKNCYSTFKMSLSSPRVGGGVSPCILSGGRSCIGTDNLASHSEKPQGSLDLSSSLLMPSQLFQPSQEGMSSRKNGANSCGVVFVW